jgi:hypothetical protein
MWVATGSGREGAGKVGKRRERVLAVLKDRHKERRKKGGEGMRGGLTIGKPWQVMGMREWGGNSHQ